MNIGITGYEGYPDKRGIAGTLKKLHPEDVHLIDPCSDVISTVLEFNFDVFINNHYGWDDGSHQVEMLNSLWKEWKTKEKTIVCISETSPDYQMLHDDIEGAELYDYNVYKSALDYACKQIQCLPREKLGHKCRVINIKPGWIDTPMNESANYYKGHKMKPEYIAGVIMWAIKQPEYVKTLTIQDDYLNAHSK